jgi:anti-anti-sigma factor
MYTTIAEEVQEAYTLFTPTDLDNPEFRDLPSRVSEILLASKRDIVLSLSHIDTVLSSHLSVFVQLYQLLQARKQRCVSVDACEAINDSLEMTQLTTLLTVFPTLQEYLASQATPEYTGLSKLDFSWSLESASVDKATVHCVGYVVHGVKMQELQSRIANYHDIAFNFARVGYIDTQSLLWLGNFANTHRVVVRGANASIKELFLQNGIQGKVAYEA